MEKSALSSRFFSYIRPAPSGCIEWVGARQTGGYGTLKVGSKMVGAHRVSWFLKYGVWPDLWVLHRCDNPACVNPEHLFLGTAADNNRDRDEKGRHRALRGDDAPWAKLTGLEVSEIIALTETRMSLSEIGKLFGVGAAYVSSLRHGRYRTQEAGRGRKPKASQLHDVGGEYLAVEDIALRSGVSAPTIRDRIARGITGEALMAPKHKGPRKPYSRRR